MTSHANDDAAHCLAGLVAEHGTDIKSDPERLETLLRDCCPKHGAQIFALTSLARQGIADQIAGLRDRSVRSRLRALAEQTVSELGLSAPVARWAVDSWADALGVTGQGRERGSGHDPVTNDNVAAAPDDPDGPSPAPGHGAGIAVRIIAAVGALAAVVLIVAVVASRGVGGPIVVHAVRGSVPRPTASTSPAPPASRTTDADAIARVLSTYYRAVNNKDYDVAWMQYSPQQQQRIGSVQTYIAGEASSHVISATLVGVSQQSPGVDLATVTFSTNQSPADSPDGRACDRWSLVYTMVQVGGEWRIDRAAGAGGSPYQPC